MLADEDAAALRWLEELEPPIVAAPVMRGGQPFQNYVPNNDLDAVGGDLRRIAGIRTPKAVKPRLFDPADSFLYVWNFPLSDAANRHAPILVGMAEWLYQLGRGVDMAWAWAEMLDADAIEQRLAEYPGIIYRPTKTPGRMVLACPAPGALQSLQVRFQTTQNRFSPVGPKKGGQIFSQPPRPRFRSVPYNSPAVRLLYELRRAGGAESEFAPWPLARAAELVTIARDRAADQLRCAMPGKQACIERVLIGRDATEVDKAARVRIVPLPSVGHVHADYLIRRLLIEIPPNCPIPANDIEWGFSGLDFGPGTDNGDGSEVSGRVLIAAADRRMLERYCTEASTWRTVTPAALPLFAARRRRSEQHRVPERIADASRAAAMQALRHTGMATKVAEIRLQREPFSGNGERAEAFAPQTRFAGDRLWHIEIAFTRPLAGPLVIGDGRYLGLGVLAPVPDIRRDVATFKLGADARIGADRRAALLSAVRRALMSLSRDKDGVVPRLFSGHEPDGAPARSGRHEHVFLAAADLDGDGFLDRLIVAAPWCCDRSVRPHSHDTADFERVISSFTVLRAGALGTLDLAPDIAGINNGSFLGPARVWESHTPFVPTRPIRGQDDPCDVLRQDVLVECRRRDLPFPEIEILSCRPGIEGRIAARLRLTFAVALPGPVMLGRGSH